MGIHESPVVPQEETSEISACVSQRRPARSRDMDLWQEHLDARIRGAAIFFIYGEQH
jgi:hypothetical protein